MNCRINSFNLPVMNDEFHKQQQKRKKKQKENKKEISNVQRTGNE